MLSLLNHACSIMYRSKKQICKSINSFTARQGCNQEMGDMGLISTQCQIVFLLDGITSCTLLLCMVFCGCC